MKTGNKITWNETFSRCRVFRKNIKEKQFTLSDFSGSFVRVKTCGWIPTVSHWKDLWVICAMILVFCQGNNDACEEKMEAPLKKKEANIWIVPSKHTEQVLNYFIPCQKFSSCLFLYAQHCLLCLYGVPLKKSRKKDFSSKFLCIRS